MMYTTHTKDWNTGNIHEVYIWKVNPFGQDILIAKRWMKDQCTAIFDQWGTYRTNET